MSLYDTDLRNFVDRPLSEKSKQRMRRLLQDLNEEIPHMPTGLRHPFQIVREIVMEILGAD